MKKLLYIDACIRDDISRTKKIATPIINKLKEKYEVETIELNKLDCLYIVKKEQQQKRDNKEVSQEVLDLAYKVKEADRIVIAAPFWDMSFPTALKCFFELMTIFDITFSSNDKECYGLCKAEKLLYITTRGMNIETGDELEQATPYIRAISWLWGIYNVNTLAACNLDYLSEEEINKRIGLAIQEGLLLCEEF